MAEGKGGGMRNSKKKKVCPDSGREDLFESLALVCADASAAGELPPRSPRDPIPAG